MNRGRWELKRINYEVEDPEPWLDAGWEPFTVAGAVLWLRLFHRNPELDAILSKLDEGIELENARMKRILDYYDSDLDSSQTPIPSEEEPK